MSSFYEDASLVMIPSGYKTSKVYCAKPTDGAGDLTFTRSNDTATRVNSAGLIEKVRTNLLLQSNGFNTASWSKFGSGAGLAPVITANAGTAPDGTNNAFRVQFNCVGTTSSDRSILNQSITSVNSTPHTSSVYIKAFSAGEVGKQVRFITEQNGSQIIITLTADWQRVVNVGTSVATSLNFLLETRGGFTTNTAADVLLAFAQLETGDIATQYIPTTSAAVSVGPVANVPRLDYLNSSCPRLLLEPQRTNVCLWSENFDNTGWNKTSLTLTANAGISPDGYQNADLAVPTASDSYLRQLTLSFTSGTTYTASIYIKSNTGSSFSNIIRLRENSGAQDVIKNISITTEWTRFDVTITATSTSNYTFWIGGMSSWSTGENLLVWGAQVEAGAYATSYIPTLGAAVTRGADACSKTGISSLIGQTEGTMFFEIKNTENFLAYLGVDNLSTGTRILIYGAGDQKVYTQIRNSSTVVFGAQSAAISGAAKAAVSFNSSGSVFYVNGVQVATGSGTTYTNLSQLTFNHSSQVGAILNQALLFKTRLSNSDLAALTTL